MIVNLVFRTDCGQIVYCFVSGVFRLPFASYLMWLTNIAFSNDVLLTELSVFILYIKI